MATTSGRYLVLTLTGDIAWSEQFTGQNNAVSPAQSEVKDLASGANTITPPTGGGSTPTGVLIIPPSTNSQTLTAKGVIGDTGIPLSKTDFSFLSLGGTGTFVLTTGGAISGVRFIWL